LPTDPIFPASASHTGRGCSARAHTLIVFANQKCTRAAASGHHVKVGVICSDFFSSPNPIGKRGQLFIYSTLRTEVEINFQRNLIPCGARIAFDSSFLHTRSITFFSSFFAFSGTLMGIIQIQDRDFKKSFRERREKSGKIICFLSG
jgi:hypothetical protein